MTKYSFLGAVVLAASALASPAMAQQVIYNPGYCAQFYPNANCQNLGPGNPYTGSYQRRAAYQQNRAGTAAGHTQLQPLGYWKSLHPRLSAARRLPADRLEHQLQPLGHWKSLHPRLSAARRLPADRLEQQLQPLGHWKSLHPRLSAARRLPADRLEHQLQPLGHWTNGATPAGRVTAAGMAGGAYRRSHNRALCGLRQRLPPWLLRPVLCPAKRVGLHAGHPVQGRRRPPAPLPIASSSRDFCEKGGLRAAFFARPGIRRLRGSGPSPASLIFDRPNAGQNASRRLHAIHRSTAGLAQR